MIFYHLFLDIQIIPENLTSEFSKSVNLILVKINLVAQIKHSKFLLFHLSFNFITKEMNLRIVNNFQNLFLRKSRTLKESSLVLKIRQLPGKNCNFANLRNQSKILSISAPDFKILLEL